MISHLTLILCCGCTQYFVVERENQSGATHFESCWSSPASGPLDKLALMCCLTERT